MKKTLRNILLAVFLLVGCIIPLTSCDENSEQLKATVVEKLKEEYFLDEELASELYDGIDASLIKKFQKTYPEDYEVRLAEEYIRRTYPKDSEEGIIAIIKTETLSRLTIINKETKETILVIEGIFAYKIRKDGVIRFDYFGIDNGVPLVILTSFYYQNCEPEILHPYADSENEELRNRLWEEIDDFSAGKENAIPICNEEYVKFRYGDR